MTNDLAKFHAHDVINGLHSHMSEDSIANSAQQMVLCLGGKPEVLDRLAPEGRLFYIIALIVAQS